MPWTRVAVFDYVQQLVTKKTALIGLDFAFGHPFCTAGAYFPGLPQSPPDIGALWNEVENLCCRADDLYGGPFFRGPRSPYSAYYRYEGHAGDRYDDRYRITDRAAIANHGLDPCSVFKCFGPTQVGPGSIAGMRFLRRVRNETDVSIWPFDVNGPPIHSTVVEIYPRFFVSKARAAIDQEQANNIEALCTHFGANLRDAPEGPTNDMRDALVSASGMGRLAQQYQYWQVPSCAADYEGWIFGVRPP